jgi:hypothetical protein
VDGCGQRTLIVNVRDRQDQLVTGLDPQSFHVKLHGQAVKVLNATTGSESPRVVVLVDVSRNIESFDGFSLIRSVASDFLSFGPPTSIELARFSDHVMDPLEFGRPQDEMVKTISTVLKGQGQSAFFDAVLQASDALGTPNVGNSIFVITNGNDKGSKARESQVEQLLLSRGIRLFTFHVAAYSSAPSTNRGTLLTDEGYYIVQRLTELTGGSIVNPNHDQSGDNDLPVKESVRNAYDEIGKFYTLRLDLSPKYEAGQNWQIDIVDGQGKRLKNVRVSYPQRLGSCPVSAPTK